jgi:hypothetical protein
MKQPLLMYGLYLYLNPQNKIIQNVSKEKKEKSKT